MISFSLVASNTFVGSLWSEFPLKTRIGRFRRRASRLRLDFLMLDGAHGAQTATLVAIGVVDVIQVPWVGVAVGRRRRSDIFRTELSRLQANILGLQSQTGGCSRRRAHQRLILVTVV